MIPSGRAPMKSILGDASVSVDAAVTEQGKVMV